jgi:hypothetical protein
MTNRRRRASRVALTVTTAALVVAGASLAAATAKNPATMILRKADVPGVQAYDDGDELEHLIEEPLEAAGVDYEAATYTVLAHSEAKGSLHVIGWVITTADAAQAKKAYAAAQKGLERLRLSARTPKLTPLSLPSYGNQQMAGLDEIDRGTGIGFGRLLVRKNTVVWFVHVLNERRPPRTRAELIADLKTYATKQKTRVGAG